MTGQWIRFAASALCIGTGLLFMITAVFGVNRFRKALNRMHAAAMGDTMGIALIFLGLILIRGFSADSLKLLLVVLFFWVASPVSSHMLSWMEALTDEDLGEIRLIRGGSAGEAGKAAVAEAKKSGTETGQSESKSAAKTGAEPQQSGRKEDER